VREAKQGLCAPASWGAYPNFIACSALERKVFWNIWNDEEAHTLWRIRWDVVGMVTTGGEEKRRKKEPPRTSVNSSTHYLFLQLNLYKVLLVRQGGDIKACLFKHL
jgi:hypothetical protein